MSMLKNPGLVVPTWVFAVIPIIAIASCQALPSSPEPSERDVLVPMTTDEILEVIAGNTELWPGHGTGYYKNDGNFLGNWDGKAVEGSWRVENDVRWSLVQELADLLYQISHF